MRLEDLGRLPAHRRIEVNWHRRKLAAGLEAREQIEKILYPTHRETWNEQLPSSPGRFLHGPAEVFLWIQLVMGPVPVGRLEDQAVTFVKLRGRFVKQW